MRVRTTTCKCILYLVKLNSVESLNRRVVYIKIACYVIIIVSYIELVMLCTQINNTISWIDNYSNSKADEYTELIVQGLVP